MAKIIRAVKFWSETSGQSLHYGLEVESKEDLHIDLTPGREIEDLVLAGRVVDQILARWISSRSSSDVPPP